MSRDKKTLEIDIFKLFPVLTMAHILQSFETHHGEVSKAYRCKKEKFCKGRKGNQNYPSNL